MLNSLSEWQRAGISLPMLVNKDLFVHFYYVIQISHENTRDLNTKHVSLICFTIEFKIVIGIDLNRIEFFDFSKIKRMLCQLFTFHCIVNICIGSRSIWQINQFWQVWIDDCIRICRRGKDFECFESGSLFTKPISTHIQNESKYKSAFLCDLAGNRHSHVIRE